jgi:hypothetical protein
MKVQNERLKGYRHLASAVALLGTAGNSQREAFEDGEIGTRRKAVSDRC